MAFHSPCGCTASVTVSVAAGRPSKDVANFASKCLPKAAGFVELNLRDRTLPSGRRTFSNRPTHSSLLMVR